MMALMSTLLLARGLECTKQTSPPDLALTVKPSMYIMHTTPGLILDRVLVGTMNRIFADVTGQQL
jgi:hypothetical protein